MSAIYLINNLIWNAGNYNLEVRDVSEVAVSTSLGLIQKKVYEVNSLVTLLSSKPALSKLGLLSLIKLFKVWVPWSQKRRLF